jgi:hypothetical protein
MLGVRKIKKVELPSPPIMESFHTIQGEGFYRCGILMRGGCDVIAFGAM